MAATRRVFVVVSGPAGSGKTTLATSLSVELASPLISKDTIKEALGRALPARDVDTSMMLGRAAIDVMYAVAAQARGGAILESNFHRAFAIERILDLDGDVIEVFCRCERETALRRYRARMDKRDPVHFDSERSDVELWNSAVATPLGGGWPVLEVDTTEPVDVNLVVERLRELVPDRLRTSP
jgi:predicted kinase